MPIVIDHGPSAGLTGNVSAAAGRNEADFARTQQRSEMLTQARQQAMQTQLGQQRLAFDESAFDRSHALDQKRYALELKYHDLEALKTQLTDQNEKARIQIEQQQLAEQIRQFDEMYEVEQARLGLDTRRVGIDEGRLAFEQDAFAKSHSLDTRRVGIEELRLKTDRELQMMQMDLQRELQQAELTQQMSIATMQDRTARDTSPFVRGNNVYGYTTAGPRLPGGGVRFAR